MSTPYRKATWVVGALLLAGLVALPVYSGHQWESQLQAWAAQTPAQSDLRWRHLQHQRGWLSSRGSVDVSWRSHCDLGNNGDDGPSLHISYEASHLPSFAGLNRFQWSARPTGSAADVVNRLLGHDRGLSGDGRVTWSGRVRSDMSLPALTLNERGERLEVSPSHGSFAVGEKAFAFQWQFERIVLRMPGDAQEMKQVALDIDLQNRQRGTGTVSLTLGAWRNALASVEGLKVAVDTREHGDRLDSTLTESVARLQFAHQDLQDLVLQATLKDLHTASIEQVSTVLGASCGLAQLTRDERTQLREALRTLLSSGLSVGVSKVGGQSAQGSASGRLMVTLLPSAVAGQVQLAQQLNSSGELVLKGDLLDASQKQMLLSSGHVSDGPEGLRIAFEQAQGLLKVNGKVVEAERVQNALTTLDERLAELFRAPPAARAMPAAPPAPAAEPVAPTAPPAEPAAPAEAPAPAPAPAPVAVAAAEPTAGASCPDLANCLAASLRAARQEDVGAMRQAASQIDALNKPDLGNRAQSRRLNTQALDALKAGDAPQAVTLLQQALQENPREIEVASNLGFAMVKANRPKEAVSVLTQALVLDPRRTSTWAPLGEALSLSGRPGDATAALWIAWQWSGNRDKTLAAYQERATQEAIARPELAEAYRSALAWITQGRRPAFKPGA